MPWCEVSVMDQRQEFIRLAMQEGANRRELCRRFAIWTQRENQMAAFDKTNRRKLKVQKKPHFITIAPGIALRFRRNDGAGAWVIRWIDGFV
jgi:hypothetical protein